MNAQYATQFDMQKNMQKYAGFPDIDIYFDRTMQNVQSNMQCLCILCAKIMCK